MRSDIGKWQQNRYDLHKQIGYNGGFNWRKSAQTAMEGNGNFGISPAEKRIEDSSLQKKEEIK